ncbi:MAG: nitroreductase [Actinomycetales bacterium]|nr:nitroreductase [Actinomycetales bacterium]
MTSTDRLLATTRTVRRRLDLDAPVELAEIRDCLRLATQAPNVNNSQAWRWVVVTDPGLRERIATYYARAYEDRSAALRAQTAPDDEPGQRLIASTDVLADNLARVPVLVIPCALERLTPDMPIRKAANLYGGILPAVWSLQLALRTRGYGSAFTTLHLHYEREVASLLGIPDDTTQVALIPVARYSGETFRPAPRLPIEEVACVNHWATPFTD